MNETILCYTEGKNSTDVENLKFPWRFGGGGGKPLARRSQSSKPLCLSSFSFPHHPLTCQNHRTSSSRCRVSLSLYGTMWHFSAKALSLSTSQTRTHRNISGEIRTLLITRNLIKKIELSKTY